MKKSILLAVLLLSIRLTPGSISNSGQQFKCTFDIYDISDPVTVIQLVPIQFDATTAEAKLYTQKQTATGALTNELSKLAAARLREYKDSIGDVSP